MKRPSRSSGAQRPPATPKRSIPTRWSARCDGFTLIELVMASMVMLLGITSSFGVVNKGVQMLDTARRTTLAGQVLQSAMEDVRMNNWAQLTALQTAASNGVRGNIMLDNTISNYSENAQATLQSFVCTRTISDVAGSGTPATMKRILITVSFRGFDGRNHTLSYTSDYARQGLSDYLYHAH